MYNKGLYVTHTEIMASLPEAEKGAIPMAQGFALVTRADCLAGDKSARSEAGSYWGRG